jgi:hypothetical protein
MTDRQQFVKTPRVRLVAFPGMSEFPFHLIRQRRSVDRSRSLLTQKKENKAARDGTN